MSDHTITSACGLFLMLLCTGTADAQDLFGFVNDVDTLIIAGTNADDRISIDYDAGARGDIYSLRKPTHLRVRHHLIIEGESVFQGSMNFDLAEVRDIELAGNDGNDTLINNTRIPSFISGGRGKDVLYGGPGDDTLDGKSGETTTGQVGKPDELYGRGGKDMFWTASGDEAFGGPGDDLFIGTLYGAAPFNGANLYGEDGNDIYLYGAWDWLEDVRPPGFQIADILSGYGFEMLPNTIFWGAPAVVW